MSKLINEENCGPVNEIKIYKDIKIQLFSLS